MSKLSSLKAEAKYCAKNAGHTMTPFVTLSPTTARALCIDCGRYVQVTSKPAPTQLDISGNIFCGACDGDRR